MTDNVVINKLPKHLKTFIIPQNYSRYTPQDQAVWRFVMRQNVRYLNKVAHKSYMEGLKKAGISVDRIPSIEEMNKILSRIGWAAVTVDGFIPPAAFMEFQKHNVLVIAADIRPFDQIEYTPAPDIIHEAAGHAPIIADEEYAEYLRYFGEVGSKAFSSKKDYDVYEVIRHLSILKADPYTAIEKINEAETLLESVNNEIGVASEMSLIRNLHWWTVEYGLIGDLQNPKIYGAGLLSSIGESTGALKDDVIKLPYEIEAKDYGFDITKPQPQLFVTPDFKHLTSVLDEFTGQMALRTGGIEGIMKAIESENAATIEYSSGLQVSGIFNEVIVDKGSAVYIKTNSPTTLNFRNKMLEGHSKTHHKDGFGAPIGRIFGTLKPNRLLTDSDLKKKGIAIGIKSKFQFESGVTIEGKLEKVTRKNGQLILLTFTDCLVTHKGKTLFDPAWGVYDMAVGEQIISAYNGPADPEGYGLTYEAPKEKTHQIHYDAKANELHKLYQEIRKLREGGNNKHKMAEIWKKVSGEHPNEWLLVIEMLELVRLFNINTGLEEEVLGRLDQLQKAKPELHQLIKNGLSLVNKN